MFILEIVNGSHFRGGIFTVRPRLGGGANEVRSRVRQRVMYPPPIDCSFTLLSMVPGTKGRGVHAAILSEISIIM